MADPEHFGDLGRMSRDVKAIAERLKLTREALGLHQAAFGRLVGIEPQAINNYETGLRRISVDQAIKICAATGVSLDWIYRGLASGLPVNLATALQQKRHQERPKR
ncbi:helix-turn-helix domain-containing protein [Bradyrhizobium lablabi]|uniref:helix-turn-helix domain-containing protein n=1 Tax=Bradyrhizobium lablabi TaxID=722472 RepID=UPI001BA8F8BD|nr:helix-turn-helix transcriptional regulator [Bradyrhizobium lablabi]MBR0695978.1 helix-turn-helix transcriptional regulator [Bradyrhizobium lablabi]